MSEKSNGRELATLSPAAAPLAKSLGLDAERMALLCRTLGENLKPDEVQLFLAVAARTGLDPFLKQIYAIKDGNKFFIHVGIDGRRLIAQRTGLVDGTLGPEWCGPDGEWRDIWLENEPPAAARFGVLKKGCREPFWGKATYKSFKGVGPNWTNRADHQLAKTAEDHAWRKAFPYEMGGLPAYRPENDQEAGEDGEGTPTAALAAGGHTDAEWRHVDQATGEITQSAPAAGADDIAAAQTEREVKGHAAPAWADTPLGREISALVDQLTEAGVRFSLPADDASEGDLAAWRDTKRSLLKQRQGAR